MSQLAVFNSIKQLHTSQPSANVRHELDPETPLPLYLGSKVHAVTRSKTLLNILNNIGLCVSYDRVLQIQSSISNRICKHYEEEEVVCPPNLRRDLFTVAVVNNIDHKPTSATAKDSFHGTAVSLMQHQTNTFSGIDRNWDIVDSTPSSTRTINVLPSSYSTILQAAIKTKQFTVPEFEGPVTPTNLSRALIAVADERKWLDIVSNAVKKGSLAENE